MTVGELRAALEDLSPTLPVMLGVSGVFVHAVGVTAGHGMPFAVVRGQGKPQPGSRFTPAEEGMFRLLAYAGADVAQIAETLGRSEEGVKRKRKTLG